MAEGIALPAHRRRLVSLLQRPGAVIRIGDAAEALSVGRADASKILSRWVRQGWLRRVRRGIYVPAELVSLDSDYVLADPWILIPSLYAPAYVGGWTATEHWDLTEQMFANISVMTARPFGKSLDVRHGARFMLHRVREKDMFGVKSIRREGGKVPISDVHRTIIDMLNNPAVGGGVDQVADCFREYLDHPERNDDALIEYGERLGNGAVFKRLGCIAEQGGDRTAALVEACRRRLTKGYSKLDYNCKCPQLRSRWRLWVPRNWKGWSQRGH